jgi:hypothetical protein
VTRGRRQKATAPLERRPLALSRHFTETTARPFPAPAAPQAAFEVENFGRGAQSDPQQNLRLNLSSRASKKRHNSFI